MPTSIETQENEETSVETTSALTPHESPVVISGSLTLYYDDDNSQLI
ncbi:hypothetical protein CP10139811_0806 [Chlamydia ibidis]|uniref:Uncharacterized protein n=2 Tax=Chlamydia ibidis TaxID=1405396 RepID=S7J3J7_9CHLA|nr:hypothetical protein [Chlamydia ibidis]EPP34768.1 hypothetical protein CP10139811_0806 [Chlamydia ibidis]EQM63191.1 hypothetical protein H359_0126 [Chlamydia ibidis 10-1398/6]